jgi:hypothetical protein
MNRTRWIVTAVAGLAVVLGGGVALAATRSSDPASDFLGDVAKRLGVSQDKLEGAIEDTTIARIDAAVAAGDITKEEGDELKEHVRSGDAPDILPGFGKPGFRGGPLGPHEKRHHPGKGFFPGFLPGMDLMETAADYLGMDLADVRAALRDGKSLADLARDEGKSVDGLKQALREQLRKDADRLSEKLGSEIDKLVEGNLKDGFEFHLRVRPDGPMPLPERREGSWLDPPPVPVQPSGGGA